ncbi:MAG TPA: Na/Pi-cotransporter [Ruminococcaceae bacterium]|nr:Na/Pi-cotransporter [Oscillospiraceae bacterium]
MKITDVLTLLGGLALFLYGMKMMSDGLEVAAGNKLKKILEKLTTNKYLGVLVGCGVTAIIQSSSATTVMVVGFVNSGLMTLSQSVGVIMGANIGTTITGQLIALDIGMIAPLLALAGVIMVTFINKKSINYTGTIIAGLGILFIGMNLMSGSMKPLRNSQAFIDMMTGFSNPLLGILAGAVFTAIIQSSSASIGILQALAMSGVIGLESSVFVLFGQNIGTCITAFLASIGTTRNAKRTFLIHLMFNLIGTVIFVAICLLTPFTSVIKSFTPDNPASQIANTHTIFNVTTTLLLLPFSGLLAAATTKLLPDRKDSDDATLSFHNEHNIGSIAISLSLIKKETLKMYNLAKLNLETAFDQILQSSTKQSEFVEKNEDTIDYLNIEIARYISKVATTQMAEEDSATLTAYYKMIGNIERIGDHAMNLSQYVTLLKDTNTTLSDDAKKELTEMKNNLIDSFDKITLSFFNPQDDLLEYIKAKETEIDKLNVQNRKNQIMRMKQDICDGDAAVIYSEMLTDIERVSDHLLNIAELLQ